MEEMIKRKNALLEQGYASLSQIEEIAMLCTNVHFYKRVFSPYFSQLGWGCA